MTEEKKGRPSIKEEETSFKKKRGRPKKSFVKKEEKDKSVEENEEVKPPVKSEDNILENYAVNKLGVKVLTLEDKPHYSFFSTGLLALDDILGGGIPKGKIIEFYGPEGCGKSSLWQWILIYNSNKDENLKSFILDAENSIDKKYLLNMGLKNTKNIRFSTINTIRKGFSLLRVASRNNCKFLVLDSIAVLSPYLTFEEEKEMMEKHRIGIHAQQISEELKSLVGMIGEYNASLIIINQLRTKFIQGFLSTVTTTGGWALKFYAHIRLNMETTESNADHLIIQVDTEKNKINIPFKKTKLRLNLGKGFDLNYDKVQFLFQNNVIEYTDKGRYIYNSKKLFWNDLMEIASEGGLEESCKNLMELKKKSM